MERTTERGQSKSLPVASIQPLEKAQYWRSQVAKWPPLIDLPLDRPRGSVWSASIALNHYSIAPNTWVEVRRTALRLELSVPAVLLSCYALLLHRLTRQNSLVIGYVPSTRQGGGPAMLPIVSDTGVSLPMSQLLSETQQALSEAETHAISYDQIRALTARTPDSSRADLVEVGFSFAEIEPTAPAVSGIRSAPQPKADLAFDFRQTTGDLSLTIRYNQAILDSSTVDRWARHFETIASHLGLPGETLIGRIPLMDDTECQRILIWMEPDRDRISLR